MRWTWDENKNAANLRKHELDFETATLVFDDPLLVSRLELRSYEERWQTIGSIGQIGNVVVFVVHTTPEPDGTGEEVGRIISARKATAHERRAYEESTF